MHSFDTCAHYTELQALPAVNDTKMHTHLPYTTRLRTKHFRKQRENENSYVMGGHGCHNNNFYLGKLCKQMIFKITHN